MPSATKAKDLMCCRLPVGETRRVARIRATLLLSISSIYIMRPTGRLEEHILYKSLKGSSTIKSIYKGPLRALINI